MNRIDLENALNKKIQNKENHLADETRKYAHTQYLDYHKKTNKDEILVIPMEEMAELTKVLSKILRNKMEPCDINLIEEIADVQICLENLMIYFDIDKETMEYVKDIKFERSIKTINNANI